MKKSVTSKKDVHEWLRTWLDIYAKNNVTPSTIENYGYALKLIETWMPNQKLKDVSDLDIQNLYNKMAEMQYSQSQIEKMRIVLNQAFLVAIRNRMMTYNPAEYAKIPSTTRSQAIEALTRQEQKRLEEACITDMHGDFFLFLLYTGLRKMEFCNLRWNDYDVSKKIIYVRKSKTDAGIRIVPLLKICQQIIMIQPRNTEYIFSCNGRQVSKTVLQKTYLRLRKKAGVPKLTNHVCRHTFATRLIEDGAEAKAVSALLGHTNVAFTLNRYVKAQPEFLTKQIYLLETKGDNGLLTLSAQNR